MGKHPDPLAEALALLGAQEAHEELLEVVEAFRQAESIRTDGPTRAARLQAISRAARLLADAASDASLPVSAVPVDGASLAAIARAARQDHERIEAALAAPPARWVLLTTLAAIWTSRGHKLGSGPDGRFHRFAHSVGDNAGIEITHHAVRQVCAKWPEKDYRSHTACQTIVA